MELTEDFIKIMKIAIVTIGVLSIFLIFVSYNITVTHSEGKREATVLGDSILSSRCIAVVKNGAAVKSLFSKVKLDSLNATPCTTYPCVINSQGCIIYPNGKISIMMLDDTINWGWDLELGSANKGSNIDFTVAIMDESNVIRPAKMTVMV